MKSSALAISFFLQVLTSECLNIFNTVSNGVLPLKSEVEMILDLKNIQIPESIEKLDWYKEILKERENQGREAVQAAVSKMQRLTLQLDRSDGRPDINPDVLAEKFYSFAATCLRTEGAAWTAALGPFEYVGMRIRDCVEDFKVEGEEIRAINVAKMSSMMGKSLIDLDLKDLESIKKLEEFQPDQVNKILDLSVAITRIAIRYAIYKEVIEEHEPKPSSFSSLELKTKSEIVDPSLGKNPFEGKLIPTQQQLSNVMEFDLGVDEMDLPIKGSKTILIRRDHMQSFIENNEIK